MTTQSLHCPACGSPTGLWQDVMVPGWRAVTVDASPEARGPRDFQVNASSPAERDVEWVDGCLEADMRGGCSCGWEGAFGELLTADGQSPRLIHPRQERMA